MQKGEGRARGDQFRGRRIMGDLRRGHLCQLQSKLQEINVDNSKSRPLYSIRIKIDSA